MEDDGQGDDDPLEEDVGVEDQTTENAATEEVSDGVGSGNTGAGLLEEDLTFIDSQLVLDEETSAPTAKQNVRSLSPSTQTPRNTEGPLKRKRSPSTMPPPPKKGVNVKGGKRKGQSSSSTSLIDDDERRQTLALEKMVSTVEKNVTAQREKEKEDRPLTENEQWCQTQLSRLNRMDPGVRLCFYHFIHDNEIKTVLPNIM